MYYPVKNKFNVPVIVMEKMQSSLRSLVERHSELSISINTMTTILNDVCLGLQYLHSRTPPIVHRDLTPNNILLCYHHRAKISDLGVARTLEATDTTLTKIPGTFDFMAPECLGNNPVYGLPLDIFSFGGVILYITTQKWPHPAPWISFSDSGEKITLTSELQRRQQYLDKMTGICVNFKSLAISCLDDTPKNRPTVAEVLAKIKEVKNAFSDNFEIYCDISLPSKQLQAIAHVQSQKQEEELPSNQQQRQQQQCQPQLHQEQEEQQQQQSTELQQQQSTTHHEQQEQEGQSSNHKQQQQQQRIVQQNQLQDQQYYQQDQQKQQDQSEEQEQVWKNQQQLKQQEQNLERQQHQLQPGLSLDVEQLEETFKDNLPSGAASNPLAESKDMATDVKAFKPDTTCPLFIAKYDFSSERDGDLSFKKGDLLYVMHRDDEEWWFARAKHSGQEGYVPRNNIVDLNSLDAKDWFFGAVTRKHADNLLMQPFNESGSFLIRNSESSPGDYALSVKHRNVIKRYKIKQSCEGYYCVSSLTFESIPELVAHHSKTPDGLCCNLKNACLPTRPQTTSSSEESNETTCMQEMERSSIQFGRKLGAGKFGEVWQGEWNGTTEVAVKILEPGIISGHELYQEIAIMKNLKHPKLIQFYAVYTKEEPIYIITELMKHGNLLEYLRGDSRSLKLPQLIDMGAQVASGMVYLEENNYVHRDLAARNILISENLTCKLEIISMPRVLSDNIYEAYTGGKFPIKWTAPEAAMYSRFTIKSDVWSFGILLYELITYGCSPYPAMSNTQVLDALQNGYRMPCPMGCPEQLHKVMRECWKENPASRPTFETLHWKLEDFFVENEPTHFYLHEIR